MMYSIRERTIQVAQNSGHATARSSIPGGNVNGVKTELHVFRKGQ